MNSGPTANTRLSGRATLTVLLASVAIANMAYTILIPFVPTLSRQFQMGSLSIGLAFGGFAATKALMQPVGGWGADRFGARTTATAGLLIATGATGLLAVAESGSQIVMLRLIWGIGEGLAIPALYQLANILSRRAGVEPARALGWFGAAAVAGMTAGPGLVAIMSGIIDFRAAFLIGAGLTACSAVLIAYSMPRLDEVPSADSPRDEEAGEPSAGAAASRAPRSALLGVLGFGLADLVNNAIYAALEPVVPLYAESTLALEGRTVSIIFFIGLGLFAVVAAFAGGPVAKWGYKGTIAGTFGVQIAALLVCTWSSSPVAFTLAFWVVMAAQPLVYVAVRAGVAEIGRTRSGRAFGWFGLVSDLGWVLGPIAGSTLLPNLGPDLFAAMAGCAVAAVVGALVATLAERRREAAKT